MWAFIRVYQVTIDNFKTGFAWMHEKRGLLLIRFMLNHSAVFSAVFEMPADTFNSTVFYKS